MSARGGDSDPAAGTYLIGELEVVVARVALGLTVYLDDAPHSADSRDH